MNTLPKAIIDALIKSASRMTGEELDQDGFDPSDRYGNGDDCYYAGVRDGDTLLARTVLDSLGILYSINDDS